jgi:LacI family transcriptional regulator
MLQEEFQGRLGGMLDRWLAGPKPVTAIIAANDEMARFLFEAIKRRGLSIPDDLSVISFDNIDGFPGTSSPRLTSYSIAFAETGATAARLLMSQIKHPESTVHSGLYLVQGRLVERDSVRQI